MVFNISSTSTKSTDEPGVPLRKRDSTGGQTIVYKWAGMHHVPNRMPLKTNQTFSSSGGGSRHPQSLPPPPPSLALIFLLSKTNCHRQKGELWSVESSLMKNFSFFLPLFLPFLSLPSHRENEGAIQDAPPPSTSELKGLFNHKKLYVYIGFSLRFHDSQIQLGQSDPGDLAGQQKLRFI